MHTQQYLPSAAQFFEIIVRADRANSLLDLLFIGSRLKGSGCRQISQLDDQRADAGDYKPNKFFACNTLAQKCDSEYRNPDQHGAIDNAGLHCGQRAEGVVP